MGILPFLDKLPILPYPCFYSKNFQTSPFPLILKKMTSHLYEGGAGRGGGGGLNYKMATKQMWLFLAGF